MNKKLIIARQLIKLAKHLIAKKIDSPCFDFSNVKNKEEAENDFGYYFEEQIDNSSLRMIKALNINFQFKNVWGIYNDGNVTYEDKTYKFIFSYERRGKNFKFIINTKTFPTFKKAVVSIVTDKI